jgi:hypothetical protein
VVKNVQTDQASVKVLISSVSRLALGGFLHFVIELRYRIILTRRQTALKRLAAGLSVGWHGTVQDLLNVSMEPNQHLTTDGALNTPGCLV